MSPTQTLTGCLRYNVLTTLDSQNVPCTSNKWLTQKTQNMLLSARDKGVNKVSQALYDVSAYLS